MTHHSQRPLPIEPSPNYKPLTRDELELSLCAQSDPEAWFPGKGESVVQAKRVCFRCEIQARCLSSTIGSPEEVDGLRGGVSVRQRRPFWQAYQAQLKAAAEAAAQEAQEVTA